MLLDCDVCPEIEISFSQILRYEVALVPTEAIGLS